MALHHLKRRFQSEMTGILLEVPSSTSPPKRAKVSYEQLYDTFQSLEKIVHGSKIKEGNLIEKLCFEKIQESGVYDEVFHGYKIPLQGVKGRKAHKVDILCVSEEEVVAYNSKGKSFNNTESFHSLLQEYQTYERAIHAVFPQKRVSYCVLKDEYDPGNPKHIKYKQLNENGISVFNMKSHLWEKFHIDYDTDIDVPRKERVIGLLRENFLQNMSHRQLLDLLSQ